MKIQSPSELANPADSPLESANSPSESTQRKIEGKTSVMVLRISDFEKAWNVEESNASVEEWKELKEFVDEESSITNPCLCLTVEEAIYRCKRCVCYSSSRDETSGGYVATYVMSTGQRFLVQKEWINTYLEKENMLLPLMDPPRARDKAKIDKDFHRDPCQ
ncbi:OLC1v1008280C1 [Oldenlandia corymbosa var. corymbosa]|uniref:OLC1v1008280C1 n=1 Tax=Oldenlandia corymbosa var. corymbosa TaxID=529605 RepID=A0AAV1DL81_OLDCO|nr:OLC1v1008280C1 [Oldenlandia corymbosa var. corymbosa]